MKDLTINQALDLILSKGKGKKLDYLVERLKKLKAQFGGNTKIENSKEIHFIIQES
jgi:hypothetical protein